MAFEQAAIKIAREKEFEELKGAVNRAFTPEWIEKFLQRLGKKGIRIRNFEAVLAQGVLEEVDENPRSGNAARALYQALPPSDQGQMREFYLFKVEEVGPQLRARFQKLYRYY